MAPVQQAGLAPEAADTATTGRSNKTNTVRRRRYVNVVHVLDGLQSVLVVSIIETTRFNSYRVCNSLPQRLSPLILEKLESH